MIFEVFPIMLVIFSTFFGSIGAFILKKSASKANFSIWRFYKNKVALLGFLIFGTGSMFFIVALKFGSLSVFYPISSLTFIWAVLLSKKFLKEDINSFKVIGVLLIVLGVVIVGGFS
jgi:uncharacterized membrane protein